MNKDWGQWKEHTKQEKKKKDCMLAGLIISRNLWQFNIIFDKAEPTNDEDCNKCEINSG